MNKIAVKLTDIGKRFTLHHEKPTLVENILRKGKKEQFWALKEISLEVENSKKIGVVGPNGSGKTTLLEIISGITTPTTGEVITKGKVASLIELGAGFHPELTGEENILLNGLLTGMTKAEIQKKQREIINFADIGKFIDAPFYTYSSGMALRLGFSIAVYSDPDTLVLDENLSVGDRDFREKSYNKIQEFFAQGKTIIIASHLLDFLKEQCDRVVWIDKGRIRMDGPSRRVIRKYKQA